MGALAKTARVAGSVISGLALVAATGAVVVAGIYEPAGEPEQFPVSEVTVGAGPVSLVCAPAPTVPTETGKDDIDYDAQFGTGGGENQVFSQVAVVGRSDKPAPATAGKVGDDSRKDLTDHRQLRLSTSSEAAPFSVVAQPSGDKAALMSGAAISRSDSGDLRGLSASSCQAPTASAWLVGGQTRAGSSARLTLTNPGETPVEARVETFGATGQVGDDVTVAIPAGAVKQVLMESISIEPRIAVHVSASGGVVTASMQDTILDGLAPAGTATITASQAPANNFFIGPLPINSDGGDATLRLVNPSKRVATIAVSVLSKDGASELGGAQKLKIDPGTVVDIALDGIDDGTVGLAVDSDEAITGAVEIGRKGGASKADPGANVEDRAWIPVTASSKSSLLTVINDHDLVEDQAISLMNTAPDPAEVTLQAISAKGEKSETVKVHVPASSTLRVTKQLEPIIKDAVAIQISGDPIMAASVLASSAPNGTLVGFLAATPDANTSQTVPVAVGQY